MNKSKRSFLSQKISGWQLTTFIGSVICLSATIGFLGPFHWILDLFSHFRVQYAISLGLFGLLYSITRRLKTALVFICIALLNFSTFFPLYTGRNDQSIYTKPTLKAVLLNVNTGLGDPKQVEIFVVKSNPDILVLEEINEKWIHDLNLIEKLYPYSFLELRNDHFGIGLFSKLPISKKQTAYIGDAAVPTIIANVTTEQGELQVIATHPLPPINHNHSNKRNSQLEGLPDYVSSSIPTILLGDLNTTPWNYYFKRLLKRSGLNDSATGFGVQPTWPSQFPILLIPLDHFLHSNNVQVVHRAIGTNAGSDHHAIIVEFALE